MLKVGVIGCGYWGPNLIRNFSQLSSTVVKRVSDLDQARLKRMAELYPGIETTTDYRTIIDDPDVDAVAIATPVHTHHGIALDALNGGKHVLVEKPIAASIEEAEELVRLAGERRLKLMVGHTFLFTSAVRKMKEIIDSGELGEIYYINSQRLNLGLFQQDINVVWDLAPHDISIILYLLGQMPRCVTAVGASHINPAVEDIAILTMEFSDNLIAFVQNSWLDPDKVRKMTVVGSRKMMVYDDVQPTEKIRIYDKRVEKPKYYDTFAEFPYSYKYGDILIPKINGAEPLHAQVCHFVDCILNDVEPITSGKNGLDVVKVLDAAQRSLDRGNNKIRLR
ncbi:MAG: Gfo/Idh/MocA family oxidoreductase [Deltaproteobacteria bacterium]|nr:Gfo/Idh/MocA family oxidoreductase [Deltaproteobacteria bacterium]